MMNFLKLPLIFIILTTLYGCATPGRYPSQCMKDSPKFVDIEMIKQGRSRAVWCLYPNEEGKISDVFSSYDEYNWLDKAKPILRWNWCEDGECDRLKSFGHLEVIGFNVMPDINPECRDSIQRCASASAARQYNLSKQDMEKIKDIYFLSDEASLNEPIFKPAKFENGAWRIPVDEFAKTSYMNSIQRAFTKLQEQYRKQAKFYDEQKEGVREIYLKNIDKAAVRQRRYDANYQKLLDLGMSEDDIGKRVDHIGQLHDQMEAMLTKYDMSAGLSKTFRPKSFNPNSPLLLYISMENFTSNISLEKYFNIDRVGVRKVISTPTAWSLSDAFAEDILNSNGKQKFQSTQNSPSYLEFINNEYVRKRSLYSDFSSVNNAIVNLKNANRILQFWSGACAYVGVAELSAAETKKASTELENRMTDGFSIANEAFNRAAPLLKKHLNSGLQADSISIEDFIDMSERTSYWAEAAKNTCDKKFDRIAELIKTKQKRERFRASVSKFIDGALDMMTLTAQAMNEYQQSSASLNQNRTIQWGEGIASSLNKHGVSISSDVKSSQSTAPSRKYTESEPKERGANKATDIRGYCYKENGDTCDYSK